MSKWTFEVKPIFIPDFRSMPPLFGWNRYILEGMGTTCSFDYITRTVSYRSFILGMFFGGFVLPLLIIIVCYISIYVTVRSHQRTFRNTDKMRIHKMSRKRMMRGKRQTTKYNQAVEYKTAKTAMLARAVLLHCMDTVCHSRTYWRIWKQQFTFPVNINSTVYFRQNVNPVQSIPVLTGSPKIPTEQVMLLLKGPEYPSRFRRQAGMDSSRRLADFLRGDTNSHSSFSSVEPRSPVKRDVNGCPELRINYSHRKLQYQPTSETSVPEDDKAEESSDPEHHVMVKLVKVKTESVLEKPSDTADQL